MRQPYREFAPSPPTADRVEQVMWVGAMFGPMLLNVLDREGPFVRRRPAASDTSPDELFSLTLHFEYPVAGPLVLDVQGTYRLTSSGPMLPAAEVVIRRQADNPEADEGICTYFADRSSRPGVVRQDYDVAVPSETFVGIFELYALEGLLANGQPLT